MTNETLSALLDGECTSAEVDRLLAAMERDSALKAHYSRLVFAREALHGRRAKALDPHFAGRVLAGLDEAGAAPSTVVPFRLRRAPAWRPLAGLAAAAGIAAVAVLALRPGSPEAPAQVLAATPAAAEPARHWTELDAANARRLNSYVSAYRQSRSQQGVGGTLSHARYASHVEPAAEAAVSPVAPHEAGR